ncbi:MAG: acyl--CoA ligase [Bacilli bacterium]|jgi:long-chain acyl-CoA synthetase|nr:acyl--CoA ligase [Bacilli bacterium]
MNTTLYAQFHQAEEGFPHEEAVRYEGRAWTYERLNKEILLTAGKLARLGFKKGDLAMIALPNCFASLLLFYAVNALGGVSYPIHPRTPAEQLKSYLKRSHPKLVFVLGREANLIHRVLREESVSCVSVNPFFGAGLHKRIAYHGFSRLEKGILRFSSLKSEKIDVEKGSESDLAICLNTGGTSGEPRIVALQNGTINRLGRKGYPLIGGKVTAIKMLTVVPLCHGFGLVMGIHTPLSNGASTVLMNRFSTKTAIRLIKKGQATAIIGVPALFNALLSKDAFAGKWLQKQIIAFVGGDSVPESLLTRWNETMEKFQSPARLYQGYGLTETVNVSNVNTAKKHRLGSVGTPLPGLSEIIVDPKTHAVLPPLSHGEILIAGDTLMQGYLDGGASGFIEVEGTRYVKTGDYGYLDEDGYLFFEQRLRRIVKIKGETVCPSQVEKVALSFYEIYEAYAYGVPDERNGQAMHLALVFREGYESGDASLLLDNVSTRLKKNLPAFAIPTKTYFLKSLPKTAVGKIDEAAIRALDK